LSPIDAKGASKKYGRARARVHTAYTTFPQAPKSRNSIHYVSQLHAFAEEKSAAPPLRQDILGRNLEKFSTHAVEKHGSAKIILAGSQGAETLQRSQATTLQD
jgi:hypothetical protein